jgi:hypothetical protein
MVPQTNFNTFFNLDQTKIILKLWSITQKLKKFFNDFKHLKKRRSSFVFKQLCVHLCVKILKMTLKLLLLLGVNCVILHNYSFVCEWKKTFFAFYIMDFFSCLLFFSSFPFFLTPTTCKSSFSLFSFV